MKNVHYQITIEQIRQAQQGDQESIARLTTHARGKVFVYIYRLTLDVDLSEDLAQEIMLQLLRAPKRTQFPNRQSFWAWLYRTALGNVQHHFRQRGRKGMDCQSNTDINQLVQHADQQNCTPLRQLMREEMAGNLMEVFAGLKMEHRNILALRCLDGLPYAQIATILGGSQLRARLLFLRAKQSLKQKLIRRGFDKRYLLSALTVFGALGMSRSKIAYSTPTVTAAQVSVTPGIAALGLITSKLGLCVALVAVATALIWWGTGQSQEQQEAHLPEQQASSTMRLPYPPSPFDLMNRVFSSPTSLINVGNPRKNQWQACDSQNPNGPLMTVTHMNRRWGYLSLILPPGQILEMAFPGPILDDRGPDIFVTNRSTGTEPQIYVTDGAGQECALVKGKRYTSRLEKYLGIQATQIAFDLSDVSIRFQPKRVRLIGPSSTGRYGGYELTSVNARIALDSRRTRKR